MVCFFFFFFKQKTAYEMRISDWSSDVCSSDLAIRNGAVVVQRGKNMADFLEYVVNAHHIEKGLLLTRERRVGQVFGRRRRAHGERPAAIGVEGGKSAAHGLLERSGERRVDDPLTDFLADRGQFAYVVGVERGQALADALVELRGLQKIAKSVSRGGEPARYPDPGFGQLTDHLSK